MVLCWVSSNSKVLKNEKANATAKDMAYKKTKEIDHRDLLTYIKAQLQKARSAKFRALHLSKSQEREATGQGFYILLAKSNISQTLCEA